MCQARGNKCFRAGRFAAASSAYTAALAQEPSNLVLLGNRAASRLGEEDWAGALADSQAVLAQDPDNFKCLYRAAESLLMLQRPEAARPLAAKLSASAPPLPAGVRALVADVERACHEQHGLYDLNTMLSEADAAGPGSALRLSPHHCEFVSDALELMRPVEGKGRGVFARRDLAAGELLMATRAFAIALKDPDQTDNLLPDVVDMLRKHPERLRDVLALTAGAEYDRAPVPPGDGAIDVGRLSAICERNGFAAAPGFMLALRARSKNRALGLDQERRFGDRNASGLWVEAASFNHSCSPNCNWGQIGDFLFVAPNHATPAGTELCIAYCDVLQPTSARWDRLQFECCCERCGMLRRQASLQAAEEQLGAAKEACVGCWRGMGRGAAIRAALPEASVCREVLATAETLPLHQQNALRLLCELKADALCDDEPPDFAAARALYQTSSAIADAMGLHEITRFTSHCRVAAAAFALGDADAAVQMLRRWRGPPGEGCAGRFALLEADVFRTLACERGPCWSLLDADRTAEWDEMVRGVVAWWKHAGAP